MHRLKFNKPHEANQSETFILLTVILYINLQHIQPTKDYYQFPTIKNAYVSMKDSKKKKYNLSNTGIQIKIRETT